jgi:hypothetical protein
MLILTRLVGGLSGLISSDSSGGLPSSLARGTTNLLTNPTLLDTDLRREGISDEELSNELLAGLVLTRGNWCEGLK